MRFKLFKAIFILCFSLIDTNLENENYPIFEGEVFYKSWSGVTIDINEITNVVEYINHPLLLDEVSRFQITEKFLIESSIKHSETEIHNSCKVQRLNHQNFFLTKPPTSIDTTALNGFFNDGGIYPYKYKNSMGELKKTKSKKYILGFECRKFTEETYNKNNKKEYVIEYWLNEDMKFYQYVYNGSFGDVFINEGIVMERIGLLKETMDTTSKRTIIELRIKNKIYNPFETQSNLQNAAHNIKD